MTGPKTGSRSVSHRFISPRYYYARQIRTLPTIENEMSGQRVYQDLTTNWWARAKGPSSTSAKGQCYHRQRGEPTSVCTSANEVKKKR